MYYPISNETGIEHCWICPKTRSIRDYIRLLKAFVERALRIAISKMFVCFKNLTSSIWKTRHEILSSVQFSKWSSSKVLFAFEHGMHTGLYCVEWITENRIESIGKVANLNKFLDRVSENEPPLKCDPPCNCVRNLATEFVTARRSVGEQNKKTKMTHHWTTFFNTIPFLLANKIKSGHFLHSFQIQTWFVLFLYIFCPTFYESCWEVA